MKIAVVIPTYNEAGGIGAVLDSLSLVSEQKSSHEWVAVVVDGNSTDTTRDIVRKRHYPTLAIHLLEEKEKGGIGRAYVAGIRYAKENVHADAFVELDGDGQHNPKDLIQMTEALEQGFDYVIGSRYIHGGSIPHAWALYRKFLSRFGSLFARLLLELPVHDVTSGLRLTRIHGFIDHLPLAPEQIISYDYAYKIQFLMAMNESGARIKEVPITFRERLNDTSKSTARDIIESLKVTLLLRFHRLTTWRLLRVVGIGGIGFIFQTTIFELLSMQTHLLAPSSAAVIGGECAILSNFFLNERFSFKDRIGTGTTRTSRLIRFHAVSAGSILTQWLLLITMEQFTSDATTLRLTYLISIALGFIINYSGYYFFVWQDKRVRS